MIARMLTFGCVLALSVARLSGAETATPPAPRSLTAIRTDVSDALRAEATSRRAGNNTPQVLRLVDLFLEMAAHPQRDTSPLLNDLGQQVRIRLETVRDRIDHRLTNKSPSTKNSSKPASISAKADGQVLAQQVPAAAGGARGAAAGGLSLVATGSQAVAARPTDFGPELVELIQATISPATWRINGGNSAIVYYAPWQALVVSAPDDVHAKVGGVLQQLHAAQRRQDGAQVVTEAGGVRAGE